MASKTFTTFYTLNYDDIHRVCISQDYCTYASNREYDELLVTKTFKSAKSLEKHIIKTALRIFELSETEKLKKGFGCYDDNDLLEIICFNLHQKVSTYYSITN